jgi:hypothetical protein
MSTHEVSQKGAHPSGSSIHAAKCKELEMLLSEEHGHTFHMRQREPLDGSCVGDVYPVVGQAIICHPPSPPDVRPL